MLEEEKEREKELKAKIATALDILNLDKLEKELGQLTAEQNDPAVFNDFNKLKEVNQKVSKVEKTISPWKDLQSSFEEVEMLIEIAVEEKDINQQKEIAEQLTALEKEFAKLEVLLLFQDKFDEANAYLTIHSGAGGTESCDWASMLLRMYERWSEQKDFQYSIVGYQAGEEAGLKSVCLLVKGMYAYGLLKGESGVHRLVRISPFDSNKKRHTSFASVMVTAEIDDDIEVDINPADLRIDTYRASGAGGQHVNTTDSAVRITHQPTGIVVTCQAERSQHQNKEAAFKILRARLYEDIRIKQEAEMESKNADKKKIEWGSQIRSYVFHPYRMVKDHRMDYQTSDVLGVMDGAIDDFLNNFLKHSKK